MEEDKQKKKKNQKDKRCLPSIIIFMTAMNIYIYIYL